MKQFRRMLIRDVRLINTSMGQLAIAVRITFDRWRHMFEAEVVMQATVDMVIL